MRVLNFEMHIVVADDAYGTSRVRVDITTRCPQMKRGNLPLMIETVRGALDLRSPARLKDISHFFSARLAVWKLHAQCSLDV